MDRQSSLLCEWMSQSIQKIQSMKQIHTVQRLQTELLIETTPRDSRYTQTLVDMMQKEESLIRDGKSSLEFAKRVDEALKQETSLFFARVSQQNSKKANILGSKLMRERELLKSEIIDQNPLTNGLAGTSSKTPQSNSPFISTSATNKIENLMTQIQLENRLETEASRLDEIYYDRWLEFEGFNLEEAFRSQRARIESEWENHRVVITETFKNKKKILLGQREYAESASPAAANSSPSETGRWQHPEKQKTLIHTAPVLSPTVTKEKSAAGSALRAVRGKGREAMNAELELLEQQFTNASELMDKQKTHALRWMLRQKVRLMSHAEEEAAYRKSISSLLKKERHDFQAMINHLKLIQNKLTSSSNTHSNDVTNTQTLPTSYRIK